MSLTNFPNGVSSFGIPVMGGGGIPATYGKVYFVDSVNGSDGNRGLTKGKAFKTISKANDAVTTNKNDVVLLSAYSAHPVTEMLTVAKNRVHFIGLDGRVGYGMGARARVTMGVTTVATDIAVMKNTGVGNTFTGIKFDSANTVAESLYSVAEGGEYAVYARCEFYKSTDLDVTGAAEILNNGDSAQWLYCTIGSTANSIADNVIRPNMLLTATLSGAKCRDNVIDHCEFLSKSDGTEHVAVYGANATDVERKLVIRDSIFFNNPLSALTPAHAVGFGAAQTEGAVLLKDCTSVDHTVMAQAAVGIYVDGAVPTFATSGVSVAA